MGERIRFISSADGQVQPSLLLVCEIATTPKKSMQKLGEPQHKLFGYQPKHEKQSTQTDDVAGLMMVLVGNLQRLIHFLLHSSAGKTGLTATCLELCSGPLNSTLLWSYHFMIAVASFPHQHLSWKNFSLGFATAKRFFNPFGSMPCHDLESRPCYDATLQEIPQPCLPRQMPQKVRSPARRLQAADLDKPKWCI